MFTRKLSSRIAERLSDTNDYEETRPKKNDSLRNLMNKKVRRNTFEKKFVNSDELENLEKEKHQDKYKMKREEK